MNLPWTWLFICAFTLFFSTTYFDFFSLINNNNNNKRVVILPLQGVFFS